MKFIRKKIKAKSDEILKEIQSPLEDLLEISLGSQVRISSLIDIGKIEKISMGIYSEELNLFASTIVGASFAQYKNKLYLINPVTIPNSNYLRLFLTHELGHLFVNKLNASFDLGGFFRQKLQYVIEGGQKMSMRIILHEGFADFLSCRLALSLYNEKEMELVDDRISRLYATPPLIGTTENYQINPYSFGLPFFDFMIPVTSNQVRRAKSLIIRPDFEEVMEFTINSTYNYFN